MDGMGQMAQGRTDMKLEIVFVFSTTELQIHLENLMLKISKKIFIALPKNKITSQNVEIRVQGISKNIT